jgi:hypothetical protein
MLLALACIPAPADMVESAGLLALADESPDIVASPDVLALARARRRGRLRRVVLPDVLPFCEVIMPPRVSSVVLLFAFCANTTKSTPTRAAQTTSTNKSVV